MKKTIKLTAIVLSLAFLLVGCANEQKSVAIKDREGSDFTPPSKIDTIISLAPSTTQILIDLGLEDKLAAVDTYSQPLLKEGTTLPLFDIMNPDAEKLASLDVDIIFATGMSKVQGEDPLKLLKDMGAVVTYIPTSATIADIKLDIAFIADVTGTSKTGKSLVETMEKEISKYEKIGKTITDKKSVYFEIGAAPSMYSFGTDVFLNEIIELIGATNILAGESGWISVAPEVLVAANPDVILTNVDYIENPTDEIKARPGFADVNAVKNNQVFSIDNRSSSYTNHKIVDAIKEMAQAIYPEDYK